MKFTKTQKEIFAKMGRKGGKNRAASMTPEERRILAQKAVNARWAKTKPASGGGAEPAA